jgi:alkanesulfonate monooxygenase SsuD/methylene tetrahydromethanopterin reductase-like flavin-dependent oxidoreductase (luciferase family)
MSAGTIRAMQFGLCLHSKIDDIGLVSHAEELGYDAAWFADSQLLWSDAYACLALAAERTRRIRLGTGVSVVDTRLAPVTAHSIATINVLAPGRTFLGVGNGFTAWRLMGRKPARLTDFEAFLATVRQMLRGEVAAYRYRGEITDVAFQMADLGFVNVTDPVPIHVSAFGPKGQRLAGAYGDGLVVSVPPIRRAVERCLANVVAGATEAGRAFDRSRFALTTLTATAVLEPGEGIDSDRVVDQCGPMAVMALHYAYERQRQFGVEPPVHLRGVWDRYVALVEQTPESRRHFRIHAGHGTYLHPDERQFATPELIKATCLVGGPAELAEQVGALEDAGLDHIMVLPSFAARYRAMEELATKVFPLLG